MPIKKGELVFLWNCADGYLSYVCEHSVVASMLWNPKLNRPDVERAEQLKAKERRRL